MNSQYSDRVKVYTDIAKDTFPGDQQAQAEIVKAACDHPDYPAFAIATKAREIYHSRQDSA